MALVDRRRVTASSAVVCVALLIGSGATIGSDPDSESFDPATFAKGIEDHFRIEYGSEMVEPVAFDPVTFAKGIEDHFWIEYGAEYGE
jgi:hypothetical protein